MVKVGLTKFNKCIRREMKGSTGLSQSQIRRKFKKAAKKCGRKIRKKR